MDESYFDFYDMPTSIDVDLAELKRKYYAYSRKYHPDFYTLQNDEAQAEALRLSTLNNEAYQTLRDKDARIAYMLRLAGVWGTESRHTLPQDFLLEMMEINEHLADLADVDIEELRHVEQVLSEKLHALDQTIAHLSSVTVYSDTDWQVLKEYLLKKKYLLRLQEKIDNFASAS